MYERTSYKRNTVFYLALQKMLTGYKNDEIMVFQRHNVKFALDSIHIFGRH